jgi:hypothetical protein
MVQSCAKDLGEKINLLLVRYSKGKCQKEENGKIIFIQQKS